MRFLDEEVRSQFKNLKDMFRRKVKRIHQQQRASSATVEEPGWPYFAHLRFLEGANSASAFDDAEGGGEEEPPAVLVVAANEDASNSADGGGDDDSIDSIEGYVAFISLVGNSIVKEAAKNESTL